MTRSRKWWLERRDELTALAAGGAPVFVYDDETLNDTLFDLAWMDPLDRLLYRVDANSHPRIEEKAYRLGAGFTCSAPRDPARLLKIFPGIGSAPVVFAPLMSDADAYAGAFGSGAVVLLHDRMPLEAWPEVFRDRDVFLSLDPGKGPGAADTAAFRTAGADPGRTARLAAAAGARVRGLYVDVKGRRAEISRFRSAASRLSEVLGLFPDVSVLFLGDFPAVPPAHGARRGRPPETKDLLARIRDLFPRLDLWAEAGGAAIAWAGVLLVPVTAVRRAGGRCEVRIPFGMEVLRRSAKSGRRHGLVNLSRIGETGTARICVTGDDRRAGDAWCLRARLAAPREGDILLITGTGALGPYSGAASCPARGADHHYLCARKMCPVPL